MNLIDTRPLQTFRIDEQITAPQLRTERGVLKQIDEVVQLARPQRQALIADGPAQELSHGNQVQMGTLLAHALIEKNVEAIEAIGLFWVNRSTRHDGILANLWGVLQEEGRLDLLRPALKALHSLAFQVWAHRESTLDAVAGSEAGLLTPQQRFSALCETVCAGAGGPTGVAGWCRMGHWLAQIALEQGSAKDRQASFAVAQALHDIFTTVPDTRAWKAPAFLATIALTWTADAWKNPLWWTETQPVLDNLTDGEAGLILRRLADVAILGDGRTNEPDKLARYVVGRYPDIGLETWLLEDVNLLIRSSGLNSKGWGGVRLQLMTEKDILVRDYTGDYHGLDFRQLHQTAMTYERLVSWLGPDRFDRLDGDTRKRLEELLTQPLVKDLPLPALRSALDRLSLVEGLDPIAAGIPGVVPRKEFQEDPDRTVAEQVSRGRRPSPRRPI